MASRAPRSPLQAVSEGQWSGSGGTDGSAGQRMESSADAVAHKSLAGSTDEQCVRQKHIHTAHSPVLVQHGRLERLVLVDAAHSHKLGR